MQFDGFLSVLEQKLLVNHEIYYIGAAELPLRFPRCAPLLLHLQPLVQIPIQASFMPTCRLVQKSPIAKGSIRKKLSVSLTD